MVCAFACIDPYDDTTPEPSEKCLPSVVNHSLGQYRLTSEDLLAVTTATEISPLICPEDWSTVVSSGKPGGLSAHALCCPS